MNTTNPNPHSDLDNLVGRLQSAACAPPNTENLIQSIRIAEALGKQANIQLQHSVTAARSHGVSWQAIGDSLGTSRQAAFKRFSPSTTESAHGHNTGPAIVDLASRTEQVFANLAARDFESVKVLMTFACSRALTKRKVMTVWEQMERSTGAFESCSHTIAQTLDGRNTVEKFLNQHLAGGVVIRSQLHHESGEWTGRVAYNSAGKVTGIVFAAPGSENLAF